MTFNDRSFALAQLGYLPVIAITALILPGAGMTTLMLSMAGSWIVTALCYQATSGRNSVGWWTLLAMQTILGATAAIMLHRQPEASPIAFAANITLTGIAVIATASLSCRIAGSEGIRPTAVHNRALIATAATLPFISACRDNHRITGPVCRHGSHRLRMTSLYTPWTRPQCRPQAMGRIHSRRRTDRHGRSAILCRNRHRHIMYAPMA